MPRKPAEPDSALMRFAALLAGHLSGGTRPARAAGEPWKDAGFAREVPSGRDNDYVSPRTVSNWRKGTALPDEIEPVLRALFGPEGNPRHAAARETLRTTFLAARDEKAALVVARAKRDPAGGRWIPEGDHFTLDRTTRPTDARAAADPVRRQLQRAICAAAADLAGEARRLGNSRTWKPLPATADMLCAIVQGEPQAVVAQLGEAYAALLRLGRFLDTDTRLQNDPGRHDEPLDADLHGLLTDLVRLAAPWLRGFPTVAKWDDDAGRTLVREDLFQPARAFARVARDTKAIADRDAAELGLLGETAAPDEFQGAKAGARAVGHTGNLILAGAEALALARLPETEADPDRAGRAETARAMLAAGKAEVDALSASWPEDLRHALRLLVEDRPAVGAPRAAIPALPAEPVPEDVEEQAHAMILEGRAPPAEWRPFLHNLNFAFFAEIDDLKLLAGLTSLQSLDLWGTQVSDLSPLAGLTNLQSLDLNGTQVSDLSPLAGLTNLQSLDLRGTQVSDLSPLAGLTTLQSLYLSDTQVSDLSPLAGLTNLQSLDLSDTQVGDLSPLAGLTTLRRLDLMNTQVSDLSPLSGLTTLQSLDLWGTQVSDLSPLASLTDLWSVSLSDAQVSDLSILAGLANLRMVSLSGAEVSDLSILTSLTRLASLSLWDTKGSDLSALADLTDLQSLDLTNTQVNDLSPLSGLTSLQSLDLWGTQVSDLSPLAGLTNLERLDLNGTQVSDLSPLAGLTNLQSLDLRDAQVSDLSPLAGLTTLQSLYLSDTQVSDLSPLAGLTTLLSLSLGGTQVSDLSPLAGLTSLQSLDLTNTQVSDLSPLAGLTTLQSLDLRGTQVSDLSPVAKLTNLHILHDLGEAKPPHRRKRPASRH